uniref:NADH-ubiquinone oxidoreductase chain 1 n=1 Tax=Diptera sp. 53 LC-2017 TaxID=2030330 RepID=A0A2D1CQ02_9DIPT|nr:NADH dehydrogenase subunit 1 [Diptera sp. 53 LC-2017]
MMIFMMFMILICVTFLTLLEQKVLSYIQIRKGPNKLGMMGMFQPFGDAIKLFFKELIYPIYSNYLIYYFCPIFSLMLSLILWMLFPFLYYCYSLNLYFLFMFSVMSFGVYFIMISGWSSNSSYSLLGSLRSVVQTISYEVCMILIFMIFILFILSFNMMEFLKFQQFLNFIFFNLLFSLILFVIFLAETNRSPFDFAEGESELVSGFNIEYSSGGFALIFLAEYMMILFLSMIFCFLFLFKSIFYFLIFIKFLILNYLFIWIRGAYPRFRYDKLMYLTWKIFLMISLISIIIYYNYKLIMIMM